MPRPVGSVKTPSYCHHKASDRAYVTISGKPVYLGKFNSAESRREFNRVVGEFLASGRRDPNAVPDSAGVTVSRVIAQFLKHAKSYYRTPDGGVAPEAGNYRDALMPLLRLHGRTLAVEFGGKSLRVVRDEMIR